MKGYEKLLVNIWRYAQPVSVVFIVSVIKKKCRIVVLFPFLSLGYSRCCVDYILNKRMMICEHCYLCWRSSELFTSLRLLLIAIKTQFKSHSYKREKRKRKKARTYGLFLSSLLLQINTPAKIVVNFI